MNRIRITAVVLSFTLVAVALADAGAVEITSVFDQEVARFQRLAASKHVDLRVEAAQGFKYLKHHSGEAALLPLVRDGDLTVRLETVKALGVCGGRRSVSVLIDRLTDTEWEVRTRAHISLCHMTGQDIPAQAGDKWRAWLTGTNWTAKEDALLRAVNGADTATLQRALKALRSIGSRRCEAALLARVGRKPRLQGEDHGLLAMALERIGSDKSVGYLAGLAQSRLEAIWALGQIGGPQAEAALLEALQRLRFTRCDALVNLDRLKSTKCRPMMPMLRRVAKQDIIWAIRQEAAQAVNDIELSRPPGSPAVALKGAKSPATAAPEPRATGPRKEPVPQAKISTAPATPKKPLEPVDGKKLLQAVLTGTDADAAVALARQGSKALTFLRRGLGNRGRGGALCAWALWRYPVAGTEEQLRVMLKSTDQVAGYWAARALGSLGDRKSVKALADLLPKDPNGYWELGWGKHIRLRSGAAKWVKTPEFAPADMPNIRVTYAAMEALGRIGGPEAGACLVKALTSPQYLIRYGAARGLGAMKIRDALGSLTRLASADPVLIVREAAGDAVAKIHGTWKAPAGDPPAMPKALVFIKSANRTESNQGFRDSYFSPKTPWYHSGENLYVLSPVGPTGSVRNLTRLTGGAVQGPEVSHDGKRVLFGMRINAKTKGFGIHEMNLDGTGLRKLTGGNCNDVDPCYLPDGRIMFCSDRAGYREFYHQERSRVLYVMNADGSDVRQVTFNPNQDYEPLVLRSGEVLYSSYRFYAQDGSPGPVRGDHFMQRIETVFRTIRPDGSNDQLFYGAMRGSFFCPIRPMPDGLQYSGWHRRGHHIGVSVSQARQMPDGGVVCMTPAGLTRLDARRTPLDCERPLYPEIINLAGGEETYIHNHDNMNPVGRFTTPAPAGGDWVFVSHAPWHKSGGKAYGIYLCHMPTRRMIRVYDDPAFSDVDPVPVVSRPREPVLAPNVAGHTVRTGTIYCASVYNTDLPFDKKSVKYVRVVSVLYQPLSINANASFRTRDLGTAPLDKDGSFNVEVPADTALRFELLDANGRVVVHETALNYVRPGERKGCVGCHEPKDMTLGASRPLAVKRRPARTIAKRGDLIYMGRPHRTFNLIVRE